MFQFLFVFTLILLSFHSITTITATFATKNHHRRILHQPLFPLDQSLPPSLPPTSHETKPPFPSPQPQPSQQPKYPFSTTSPPSVPLLNNPFFPFYPPAPPPPQPPPSSSSSSNTIATFPANISSLILPHSSASSDNKPISRKLIAVIVSVSILSATVIVAAATFLIHRHRYHRRQPPYSKTDSLRLFPPDTVPSDSSPPQTDFKKHIPAPPPPELPRYKPSSTSSEFLYLGTVVSSREVNSEAPNADPNADTSASSVSQNYQRLGSPELQPLPPLPRHHFQQISKNDHTGSDEEEEFFSPRGSAAGDKLDSPERSIHGERENLRSHSSNSYHFSNSLSANQSLSSSPSIVLNLSPRSSIMTKSPDSIVNFPGPPRCIPPPPPRERRGAFPISPLSSGNTHNSPSRASDFSSQTLESPIVSTGVSGRFVGAKLPPPPPPPPPPRFWETPVMSEGPPVLVAPSEGLRGRSESPVKPKLKPLHWDKVRASSDRAMVWDQLKSSSFQ